MSPPRGLIDDVIVFFIVMTSLRDLGVHDLAAFAIPAAAGLGVATTG
ncbi:MAG: hypothetical protein RLZZ161_53 [Bacteroidota bacterium]